MADNKGYVVGDTIRVNGVDYRIKSTQSGKQESSDLMDIRITGTSVKTLNEMCGEIGIGIVDMVDRCIMCGEPVPEGTHVCYACRTRSYATVAEVRTDDNELKDLQEENEKLKEELRYKETLLECWKDFANEIMDRFATVVSRKK